MILDSYLNMTHNVPAIWPVGVFLAGCLLICICLNIPILFLDNIDAPIGYDCVLAAGIFIYMLLINLIN